MSTDGKPKRKAPATKTENPKIIDFGLSQNEHQFCDIDFKDDGVGGSVWCGRGGHRSKLKSGAGPFRVPLSVWKHDLQVTGRFRLL